MKIKINTQNCLKFFFKNSRLPLFNRLLVNCTTVRVSVVANDKVLTIFV